MELTSILLKYGTETMVTYDINALDVVASHGKVDVLGILRC